MQPRAWMLVRAPMRRRILEAEVEATAEIQRSRSGLASPAPPKAKLAMAPKASSYRRHGPMSPKAVAPNSVSTLRIDFWYSSGMRPARRATALPKTPGALSLAL